MDSVQGGQMALSATQSTRKDPWYHDIVTFLMYQPTDGAIYPGHKNPQSNLSMMHINRAIKPYNHTRIPHLLDIAYVYMFYDILRLLLSSKSRSDKKIIKVHDLEAQIVHCCCQLW